jgi:hypothetical protein
MIWAVFPDNMAMYNKATSSKQVKQALLAI